MEVRPAELHELAELPRIEQSAGETFRGSIHDFVAGDQVSPEWFWRPKQRDGLVFVAADAGRLIGFGGCEAFDDALHLWELAVRHEDQGRGGGRALIAAAAEAARSRSLPAMTLTTFRSIPWNAPFYERLGFRPLDGGELNGRLAAVLKREARNGLTDRCAMRLAL